MLRKQILKSIIGTLACVCVLLGNSVVSFAGTEQESTQSLSSALMNKQSGYSVMYGNYSSQKEAENAVSDIMKALDAPSYFNETNLYVQNSIVLNGDTYAVYCEIKQYRNIDDVDWENLVSSFELDGLTDLQKMIWVHEWICNTLTYDIGQSRTLSECLASGKAKCDEYAMIYSRILTELGIECRCVDGLVDGTNSGHMWNLVKVGGEWYFCDLTADDETDSYDNFLRGLNDDVFLMNHDKYMNGSRLCNGIKDFSGYRISKSNYFYYTDTCFDRSYDLSDLPNVSVRASKKASFKQITLSGKHYTKNKSVIKTRNTPGVFYGRVKDDDGFSRMYLVQVYKN